MTWLLALLLASSGDYFRGRVQPVLEKNCIACHNHELDDGDISFESRQSLLRDRPSHGPAVVPGEPEKSALVRAIRHNGDIQMPPGKKLPQEDIDILIEWIRRGAPWSRK